jgi:hypothetical protein
MKIYKHRRGMNHNYLKTDKHEVKSGEVFYYDPKEHESLLKFELGLEKDIIPTHLHFLLT